MNILSPGLVHLSRDSQRLTVAPAEGGAIREWTAGGIALLHDPGCFPMLPYCNRIAHGVFHWAGRQYALRPNFGDHPHTIHGTGWKSVWTVEAATASAVTLSLRHNPGPDWPFAFSARLEYRLNDDGLTIRIAARNEHAAPAPMGIGAHPYFPRPPGAAIRFTASGVWSTRNSLPIDHRAVPAEWDHAASRAVERQALDHCFTGWRPPAQLQGLTIEADKVFGNLQVYTPAEAGFFCIEPVSHVPDAINLRDLAEGQGMTPLASGDVLAGVMRFVRSRVT